MFTGCLACCKILSTKHFKAFEPQSLSTEKLLYDWVGKINPIFPYNVKY